MHTLFSYNCLFRPISILLHTLNSTLYFVLFRTFNSVNHCSYSLLVTSQKAKLWIFSTCYSKNSSAKNVDGKWIAFVNLVFQGSLCQSIINPTEWHKRRVTCQRVTCKKNYRNFTRLLLRLFSGLEIITKHRTSYTRSLHQTTVYDILHFVP